MNAIETAGLTKAYRGRPVVDRVDLVVPAGACMVLVGGNGAGKSTTLQMLMNLLPITKGSAKVLGKDAGKLRGPDFRSIGYASENQIMPSRVDVSEFFRLLRALYSNWDSSLEVEVRRRLRVPEGRALRKLSRGERMKLCIAGALPFRPQLLVMDEPLSGLDPLSRENLVAMLAEHAEYASMLIATHDLSEIERLATHVAVLDAGRLILQGEVESILARFSDVAVRVESGAMGVRDLPPNWLNPRWEGPYLSFTHRADHEECLPAELEGVLGPGLRTTLSPLTLAGVVSAILKGVEPDATTH